MTPETLITYVIAVAVIVAVPGPNVILIVSDSITHGFRKSLATIIGIKVGTSLLILLSLSGVATLLTIFSELFTVIKWIGATYLVYLGISQIRSTFQPENAAVLNQNSGNNLFVKGFLVASTNPKGLFFAGAFFPQFLDRKAPLLPQMIILWGGLLLVSFVIGAIYAYMGDKTGRMFSTHAFKKVTTRISGSVLIVFGIGLSFAKDRE